MITINLRIVVMAGMVPPFCQTNDGGLLQSRVMSVGSEDLDKYIIDVADPQTAFGLALKLDEWAEGSYWANEIASFFTGCEPMVARHVLLTMVSRIKYIGRDHGIRHDLGWKIKPGTLGRISYISPGKWVYVSPNGRRQHPFRTTPCVTDNNEALQCIYKELKES